jgi:NAD(P)-dependent dehydrogenase (short-subunit alcohol dehydrogenase family)
MTANPIMINPIIILGATGGVGSALARRLAGGGHRLHLIARDGMALAALAASLDAEFAVADVLDEAALAAAVQAAGSSASGLAYCIGSIILKPLSRTTVQDFAASYALNVTGAARAIAFAEPALRAVPGSGVVLFSSVAARAGFANHAVIGPAKAAVEGLTLALAAELAPVVRVNCIAPSLTRTRMAETLTSNAVMAKAIAAQHPLGRLGEAGDSAALAAFLLSAEAGWMTGQIIGVDGGRHAVRTKG